MKLILIVYIKKPWTSFINNKNKHLAHDQAIAFLDHLLQYDHQKRYTVQEAMNDPYFDLIKKQSNTMARE